MTKIQGVETTELEPCPFCGYRLTRDEGICPGLDWRSEETDEWLLSGICCPGCAAFLPKPSENAQVEEGVGAWNRRSPSPQPLSLVRHKKRGSEYEIVGIGRMQSEMWEERGEGTIDRPAPLNSVDMREVTIYRSVEDGSLWVRPREEFEDGRFAALAATSEGQP